MAFSVLLSTAYLPPAQYFSKIISSGTLLVEKQEHFKKQTYRNRCHIATANGLLALSIPVVHGSAEKILIKDIRISNDFHWQKVHWKAIKSAYNKSPFFEFYKDVFVPFYVNKPTFLFDHNMELIETIFRLLKIKPSISFTETYEEKYSPEVIDLRDSIHPKPLQNKTDEHFKPTKYQQVFSDKNGFLPNLSIIDLLFCQGPQTLEILHRSIV